VLIRRHDIFVSTALARFIEIARDQLGNTAAGLDTKERAGSLRGARRLAGVPKAAASRAKRRA
jgi:hypothetical protein